MKATKNKKPILKEIKQKNSILLKENIFKQNILIRNKKTYQVDMFYSFLSFFFFLSFFLFGTS